MRITQNALFDQIRYQISRNTQALLKTQEQVATQKRINRVSDSPVDAPRLLDVKSIQSQVDQFIRNIQRAAGQAKTYDDTMGQTNDLVARAKELLLGEANEVTSTPQTREAARLEIASITEQLVQIANTQYEGKSIYAGFGVNSPAFAGAQVGVTPGGTNTGGAVLTAAHVVESSQTNYDNFQVVFTGAGTYDIVDTTTATTVVTGAAYTSGGVIRFNGAEIVLSNGTGPPAAGDTFDLAFTPPGTYLGDNGTQQIEVQSGQLVQQNVTGSRVFQGVGVSGGVDIFSVLNQINDALRSNNRTQISALLTSLDSAQTQVSTERAAIGAKENVYSTILDRHNDSKVTLETARSDIEDADITEVITRLTQQQNVYEASLSAAAKISQTSLFDFLR